MSLLTSTKISHSPTTYVRGRLFLFFFFNDTATTEIYTLSLHDALPIYVRDQHLGFGRRDAAPPRRRARRRRSEEHTSELQSRLHLVCRLLLEKKKITNQLFHYLAAGYPHPDHA